MRTPSYLIQYLLYILKSKSLRHPQSQIVVFSIADGFIKATYFKETLLSPTYEVVGDIAPEKPFSIKCDAAESLDRSIFLTNGTARGIEIIDVWELFYVCIHYF